MRRTAALLCTALLVACQGSGKSDDPAQYRAWCWTRSKPLGDWTFDRAVAEQELQRHNQLLPHHSATVKVWRGDPGTTETEQKTQIAPAQGAFPARIVFSVRTTIEWTTVTAALACGTKPGKNKKDPPLL